MAPANGPAPPAGAGSGSVSGPANANRKGSSMKPVVRKRIEPAIPLPYMQRRPKQASVSAPTKPSPLHSSNGNTTPPPEVLPRPNGQAKLDQTQAQAPPTPTSTADTKPADKNAGVKQGLDLENGGAVEDTMVSAQKKQESVVAVAATQGITSLPSPGRGEVTPPGMQPYRFTDSFSRPPADDTPHAPSSATFRPHAISPPPYHMPPSFHPQANPPMHFRGPVPEPIRLPQHNFNNHSHVHQHHPSNGSLIFGGLHGSNSSSPAPHSGGAFPPGLMLPQHSADRHVPVTAVDEYGRPIMAAAPMDGPMGMNYGPNTPHSFHGSQGSRQVEENGFVHQPLVNGHNSSDLGPPGLTSASAPGLSSAPAGGPYPLNDYPREIADLMAFTRTIHSLFARPQFADCDLYLVIPDRLTSTNSQYPGKPNGPLRLPGHRAVLWVNPIMRRLITEQSSSQSPEVRITSDDPYMRADAFWRAIKYLYGMQPNSALPASIENESNVEKFHYALAYVAAGAYLETPQISIGGVGMASHWVNWDTVETGLEFALTGATILSITMHLPNVMFPEFRYKHGIYVNQLVQEMMHFIISHFPPQFTLDPTVSDPQYARLPSVSSRGGHARTSQNLSVAQAANRLSSIQFGDMATTENDTNGPSSDTSSSSSGHAAALSRILLNLPYTMLKYVLESHGLGNVSGWMSGQDRHKMMSQIIDEREARRLRFVNELVAGRLPVPAGLQGREPQPMDGVWENVAWREEMQSAELLVRSWVPVHAKSERAEQE